MKIKFMIATFTALFLALMLSFVHGAEIKYEYKTEKKLDKGIEHTEYDLFMSDRRRVKLHTIKAELTQPHLSLDVLNDKKGISYLSTVYDIAKSYDTSVAINADFFAWGQTSGRGTPVGTVFFDKVMHSTPSKTSGMETIIQKNDGTIFSDIIDYSLTITAKSGETLTLGGKNKLSDLSVPMIYDYMYDEYSLGSTETQYEAVIKNGYLSEIRFSKEPVKLEKNMYVICGLSDWNTFIQDNFKIGDKIVVKENSSIDLSSAKLAAGAGAKLVKNGTPLTTFTHIVSGNQPRSALGIGEDKKTIYLVVVDGRSDQSGGMSMTELASFMARIGAYNAVNLDGGGSSTLIAKDKTNKDQTLINTPSGGERKVSTVLSVTSSSKPTSKLSSISVRSESEHGYTGDKIKISVEGFDEYHNPVSLDKIQLIYTVSGIKGTFEDGYLTPFEEGLAHIRVFTHTGLSATCEMYIWDKNIVEKEMLTASPSPTDKEASFAVFGAIRESDTLFNNLIMKNVMSNIGTLASEAFLLSTNPTKNLSSMLNIPSYTCYPYSLDTNSGNTFMILDTEDNFMSAKEWVWFIDETRKIKDGNLFVFMQTNLNDFTEKSEIALFKDVLTDVAKNGVDVYLFGIGHSTDVSYENGVRYFTTSGFSDNVTPSGFIESKKDLNCILVDISESGEVNYRFENVF